MLGWGDSPHIRHQSQPLILAKNPVLWSQISQISDHRIDLYFARRSFGSSNTCSIDANQKWCPGYDLSHTKTLPKSVLVVGGVAASKRHFEFKVWKPKKVIRDCCDHVGSVLPRKYRYERVWNWLGLSDSCIYGDTRASCFWKSAPKLAKTIKKWCFEQNRHLHRAPAQWVRGWSLRPRWI